MSELSSDLPQAETADPDGVQTALRAAHALWSSGDTDESLRWLRRAAETASDEGADVRSFQLAKAAAELRAKLFGNADAAREAARSPASPDAPPPSAAVAPPSARAGASSEAAPSSRGGSPQYVVHRPREAPRQMMGLSPSSLETALQRDPGQPASAPLSQGELERRWSSPPPLPPKPVDEYEELEAEPEDDDEPGEELAAAGSAPGEAHVATLPPPAFQPDGSLEGPRASGTTTPPPLPLRVADDEAVEPSSGDENLSFATEGRAVQNGSQGRSWGAAVSAAWDSDGQPSSWSAASEGGELEGPSSEVAHDKLTARVHHQAVRVAMVADPRNSGQYVVRPLREGEKAAPGERVALLVALEPGQPLV